MTKRIVLVTGATGNQGGAVTAALLERGMNVRALVRDPSSPKAQALAARSVELAQGDLDQKETVEAAANGVDAAFVVTTPFAPGVGIEGEIRQGRIVIDALKAAEIAHVVYSSVSDADCETGVPHFESKADAERYLSQLGVPATVTAPVYFSENVLFPSNLEDIKQGRFRQAMPKDRKLQLVSLREIGQFNAAIIERGPQLAGRRYNYAGDELTPAEMTAALAKAAERDIAFESQPIEEIQSMSEDLALMYRWFDNVGYTADIAGLRRDFPDVNWTSFGDWAKGQDWKQLLA